MNAYLTALKPLFDRAPTAYKYDFGHVLVIGGGPGMVGAPLLTARAALRTGAGLVSLAASADVIDKLEKRVEEVMTLRLADNAVEALVELENFIAARKVTVLAIGPGLPASRAKLIKKLLVKSQLPLLLDAGGLAAYNGKLAELQQMSLVNPQIILTPHAGEFSHLIEKQLPRSTAAVKPLLLATAQSTGTTIVLKGHPTLIATADGHVYRNNSGNPGLATAGTGDVLTGILAGLLAQQIEVSVAARCGVYLHGLAGDFAAEAKTEPGLIASDVIEYIPTSLRHISRAMLR